MPTTLITPGVAVDEELPGLLFRRDFYGGVDVLERLETHKVNSMIRRMI
jgi:hypothetical protein